ncbi:MAG: biotin--[acetyl-CoA-carboxylase] ligase [Candidatus Marinimicrobia bacterium]|nr:biotin--[acetyl-CoA-carboxylase] ligase [Candidatus Neomarinimicrobiota bacterium]
MKSTANKIKLSNDLKVLQNTVLHFKTIDSTNRFLLDAEDLLNGTVVLADDQTAGRGRFNRTWQSLPETALLFSILLNNLFGRKMPSVYTFLAAVGVYRGLQASLPSGSNLSLKWPNDVLLNEKKICGILVQGKITTGRYEKLVIGIGLNVNQQQQFFVEDLKHATSLAAESGYEWDRIGILKNVLIAIDHLLNTLQESGDRPIIRMWQDACGSIGREIAIDDGKEIYRGVFDSLAEDGGLRLKIGSKLRLFYAGDVTVLKE